MNSNVVLSLHLPQPWHTKSKKFIFHECSGGKHWVLWQNKVLHTKEFNAENRLVPGGSSSASPKKSFITSWSVQKFDWNCRSYKNTAKETQTKVFTVFLAMRFVIPMQIYHSLQWEKGTGFRAGSDSRGILKSPVFILFYIVFLRPQETRISQTKICSASVDSSK